MVALVGILSVIALPSFLHLRSARDGAAAQQLYNDLIFARQRAVAIGVPHWVAIDTQAQQWVLLMESASDPGKTNASALDDPATGRSFVQTLDTEDFSGVTFAEVNFDGGPDIGFDAAGRPLNDSENPLSQEGVARFVRGHTVTITPGTGLVSYLLP